MRCSESRSKNCANCGFGSCKYSVQTREASGSDSIIVSKVTLIAKQTEGRCLIRSAFFSFQPDPRHGSYCHLPEEEFSRPPVDAADPDIPMEAPASAPKVLMQARRAAIEQSARKLSSKNDERSVIVTDTQSASKPALTKGVPVDSDGFARPRQEARLTHRNLQRLKQGEVTGSPRGAPSTVASYMSSAVSPGKRPAGMPRKPRKRVTYNSEHDFYAEVKKYSRFEAPHAKLLQPKASGVYVLKCAFPDCDFLVEGQHLKDEEDGSELQGVIVRKVFCFCSGA